MKPSLPMRTAVLLLLAAMTLARSGRAAPGSSSGVTVERIVAVVNAEIILLSEVKDRSAQMGQPIDDSGTSEVRRKSEQQLRPVLDKMVDDTLVLQQAGELKLSVEPAEVDRAVDEVKKQNRLDTIAFEQALADQGFTPAAYRADLKKQILRLKVINTAVRSRITVSDEEVKAFYDQSARQSGGHRQAHVRHVLVAVPAGAPERLVDQKRRTAVRVLEEAREGGDFGKLARTYSDDAPSKSDGGDLGWLREGEGLLPEAMSEVIFSMEPGEVRGPLRTDKGFEVLKLLERKEGDVRAFAEVKESIRQQLYANQLEKQTQSWLAELRKKAHLEIRL